MYFFIFFSFQLPYWPGSEQWERTTQVCKNFQSQKFRRQIKYKEEANVTQLDVWCWFSTTPGTGLTLVWQPSKPEGRGGRYEQKGKSLGFNVCGVECLLIRDLPSVRKKTFIGSVSSFNGCMALLSMKVYEGKGKVWGIEKQSLLQGPNLLWYFLQKCIFPFLWVHNSGRRSVGEYWRYMGPAIERMSVFGNLSQTKCS